MCLRHCPNNASRFCGGHACLEGKVVGVAVVDGVLDGLDTDDGHDGAEGLLPGDPHVLGDIVDEGRPDEVALPLVGREEGGALGLRVLHQALDEVG